MVDINKTLPTDLKSESSYAVRVRSVNRFGTPSGWSETLVVDTSAAALANARRLVITSDGMIGYNEFGQMSFNYSASTATRTNMQKNPSAEIDLQGWAGLTGTTLTRESGDYFVGAPGFLACFKVMASSAVTGVGMENNPAGYMPVTPGLPYTATAYIKVPSGQPATTLKIGLRFYNSGTFVSEKVLANATSITSGNTWVRLSNVGILAPLATNQCAVVIYNTAGATIGSFYLVDGVMVEQNAVLRDYFDGSTSAGTSSWTGTPHFSASTLNLNGSYSVNGGVFTESTIQTSATAITTGGIVLTSASLTAYNGSGNQTFKINAADGAVTIGNVAAQVIIDGALAGGGVAINFNLNNDRNGIAPPVPVVNGDGTAVDHVINTDGSADLSFEWNYTNSTTATDANNIDGFVITVYSSLSNTAYTFGSTPEQETIYYTSADKRAFILTGAAADRYYTFGVKAYRVVDTDIDATNLKQSATVKSALAGENPYQPSSAVAFAGNITGTITGVSAALVVSNAAAGNAAATNFNANNDRNATTPTAPTTPLGGAAIDHVINTDGSADISFEWAYTLSGVPTAANNIDGFAVTVYSSASASAYTPGATPAEETIVYAPADKRAFILTGAASDRYYTFGVRAYRIVDSDIDSSGIKQSAIVKSTVAGENPYLPSGSVAFAGDITGTLGGTAVATVVANASAGNAAAINFNANNDRNANVPPVPAILTDGTAIDHVLNTDGSADISFEWTYTSSGTPSAANNIDGFILYVYSSASATAYVMGTTPGQENAYYTSADKRALIISGAPADRYYTFGVRAYRVVDTDIDSTGVKQSAIVKPSLAGENPYQPSASVTFAGDITGTIGGVSVATIIAGATAGSTTAINFNANNDRNGLTPTAPAVLGDLTAVDHVVNTDGSADISFEWTYTNSTVATDVNNIDGFVIYAYSSASNSAYTFGSTPSQETVYYASADKRAFILAAASADRWYTFGVRAYRVVDTDVDVTNIKQSAIIKSTAVGENPYQPSASVAFAGNITGTVAGVAATAVVADAASGAATATNFNANNDRNALTPTIPVVLIDGTAVDHTLNTDGSSDISFEWTYTNSTVATAVNNIDGFVVYVYSSASSSPYTFGSTPAQETVYYTSADKRAFVLAGAPADKYYTFGVRAYRVVDTDIDATTLKQSAIAKSTLAGENPYQPSASVAFAGDITGTVGGTAVATIVSGAASGTASISTVTNFNANNDRNGTTPTTPAIVSDGTAIDHTLNTDGSADISFEWTYTNSTTPSATSNIDGFVIYIYSAVAATAYTFGATPQQETIYYASADKRAFILSGAASNLYYTFGVRAYRAVDSDIDATNLKQSPIVKPSLAGENPYQPSSTVAFAGDITGTVGGTLASIVVSNASIGKAAADNFNTNNDQNGTTPTAPVIPNTITALERTLNTDGSSDISLDWTYTNSTLWSATNNIDGFVIYVYSSASPATYVITGDALATQETTFYASADKRAFILSGAPSDRYYTFGVRAYRVVDSNIDVAGIKQSAIAQPSYTGTNPFQPSSTVAFAGDITGTIGLVPASTIVTQGATSYTAATNFNNNNDTNGTTPTAPTIVGTSAAISTTINTDSSADIYFNWIYTTSTTPTAANNIDGFIIYMYKSTAPSAYTFGATPDLETTYYAPDDKRALLIPAAASNLYYTFGVRAYRRVNSNVDATTVKQSAIIKPAAAGTNPFQPAGFVNYTGSIAGTSASSIVYNSTLGASAAVNFEANNDRNATTPTAPTLAGDGTAIDHTLNTDGSADISFEWGYTVSGVPTAANNIDGFIITVYGSLASSPYVLGSDAPNETVYYASPDKRAFVLTGTAADRYYTFGVRAYRVVDTDIDASGMKQSAIAFSSVVGENPYQPSSTVAFAGDITGTIGLVPASTIVTQGATSYTAATNFNTNNDRNNNVPTAPLIPNTSGAVEFTLNTDGSCDISWDWTYTNSTVWSSVDNIDGFIIYIYSSASSSPYVIKGDATGPLETIYYASADKRAFVLLGVAADRYYTFGVRAYRVVDSSTDVTGIKQSAIIQPPYTGDDPFRPASGVAFAGDITGTIAGIGASTVVAGAAEGDTAIQPGGGVTVNPVTSIITEVVGGLVKTGQLRSTGWASAGSVIDGSIFSTTGMNINLDTGAIMSKNFRIDASGNAEFKGAIAGGVIDIGGFDATSFHVDASGNVWIGDATYANAPFRISSTGVTRIGSGANTITLNALAGNPSIDFTGTYGSSSAGIYNGLGNLSLYAGSYIYIISSAGRITIDNTKFELLSSNSVNGIRITDSGASVTGSFSSSQGMSSGAGGFNTTGVVTASLGFNGGSFSGTTFNGTGQVTGNTIYASGGHSYVNAVYGRGFMFNEAGQDTGLVWNSDGNASLMANGTRTVTWNASTFDVITNVNAAAFTTSGLIQTTRSAGVWYYDQSYYANPSANRAGYGFHPGGVAGSIQMLYGTAQYRFYNVDTTGYYEVVGGVYTNASSRRFKQDIQRWPNMGNKSVGASSNDSYALSIVNSIETHSFKYQEQLIMQEVPGTERRQAALQRLNDIKASRGESKYVLPIHECTQDSACNGDESQPCSWRKNWENESIGFIAEQVHSVFSQGVTVDEEGLPMGTRIDSLLALLMRSVQELSVDLASVRRKLSDLEDQNTYIK